MSCAMLCCAVSCCLIVISWCVLLYYVTLCCGMLYYVGLCCVMIVLCRSLFCSAILCCVELCCVVSWLDVCCFVIYTFVVLSFTGSWIVNLVNHIFRQLSSILISDNLIFMTCRPIRSTQNWRCCCSRRTLFSSMRSGWEYSSTSLHFSVNIFISFLIEWDYIWSANNNCRL